MVGVAEEKLWSVRAATDEAEHQPKSVPSMYVEIDILLVLLMSIDSTIAAVIVDLFFLSPFGAVFHTISACARNFGTMRVSVHAPYQGLWTSRVAFRYIGD
eukprot:scaffold5247_cov132-Skeletonema_dohrnii-CCMP3373.AAC.3